MNSKDFSCEFSFMFTLNPRSHSVKNQLNWNLEVKIYNMKAGNRLTVVLFFFLLQRYVVNLSNVISAPKFSKTKIPMDCTDVITKLKEVFRKLLNSLKRVNSIRDLIKWYHKESKEM